MARGGLHTRSSNNTRNGIDTANTFSVLETQDRPPGDDPQSPYFISNGDHTIGCLVPKILTGCENYSSWRRSMIVALTARNKIKFIDGRLPPPDEDDELYDTWFRCNSLVISWLLHSVSNDIADSIMYLDNASTIWSELQERYHQRNAPRIFEAKRSLTSLVQGSQSVTTYFTRLKTVWDLIQEYRPQPICTYGAMKTIQNYQDEDRILEFLLGLNESYTHTRSHILLQDPLPNINRVFASVVQEEKQRGLTNTMANGTASTPNMFAGSIQTNHTGFAPLPPNRGRSAPNHAGSGPFPPNHAGSAPFPSNHPPGLNKPRVTCSHCGILGHHISKCYRLHGFPPGHKHFGKNPNQKPLKPHVNLSVFDSANPATTSSSSTSIDEEMLSAFVKCQELFTRLNQRGSAQAILAQQHQFSGPQFPSDSAKPTIAPHGSSQYNSSNNFSAQCQPLVSQVSGQIEDPADWDG